jgi:hypothetical protein
MLSDKRELAKGGEKMKSSNRRTLWLSLLLALLLAAMSGCDALDLNLAPQPQATPGQLPEALRLLALPETLVNFIVEVPGESDPSQAVYLTLLDEVTGLALNAKAYEMQWIDDAQGAQPGSRVYVLTLPAPIGAVLKYRFERQSDGLRVLEHQANGEPVRYRLYHVHGPNTLRDRVSRWTDTSFNGATGRIIGQVTQEGSQLPLPNLLVSAAGSQALTAADGSFRLENLPTGVHNLVILALDGAYQTFQQGAAVAESATTPAVASLPAAESVRVVFTVSAPLGTPPLVPLRVAGDLFQFGNTFGSLNGGMSVLASRTPIMQQLPDGRYMLAMQMPVGATLRYKYTLGDGLWNAERLSSGGFQIRQAVIPAYNVLIEDTIETWYAGEPHTLSFDIQAPPGTEPDDFIAIQFSPLFGWTEALPMWPLSEGRWVYVLFSPLNLPGNFSYRYCLNEQCGLADDPATPGLYGKGRPLQLSGENQTVHQAPEGWVSLSWPGGSLPRLDSAELPVENGAWSGFETPAKYHPAWDAYRSTILKKIGDTGIDWLLLRPTWSYRVSSEENQPGLIEQIAGADMLWPDLAAWMQQAQALDIKVALNPNVRLPVGDKNWPPPNPDNQWAQSWFEEYQRFALHHAEAARRANASALILGGDWLAPALPGGVLWNTAPDQAQRFWESLLDEVQQRYSGLLFWSMPLLQAANPPAFVQGADGLYLTYSVSLAEISQPERLPTNLETLLDELALPQHQRAGQSVILVLQIAPTPDGTAFNDYAAVQQVVSQRPWIAGVVFANVLE